LESEHEKMNLEVDREYILDTSSGKRVVELEGFELVKNSLKCVVSYSALFDAGTTRSSL
jgi:hypothetical protein